jgi:hypothetical protein
MIRTTVLARCSAAAAAAALLVGIPATAANARPDPGEPVSQQTQLDAGATKAQIEHQEQLMKRDDFNKALIEHSEEQPVPSNGRDSTTSASDDEFPWVAVSLTATGLAAAVAGGVAAQRRRTVLPAT